MVRKEHFMFINWWNLFMENNLYWAPKDTNFLLKLKDDGEIYFLNWTRSWEKYPFRIKESHMQLVTPSNIPNDTIDSYKRIGGLFTLNKILFYHEILSESNSL